MLEYSALTLKREYSKAKLISPRSDGNNLIEIP